MSACLSVSLTAATSARAHMRTQVYTALCKFMPEGMVAALKAAPSNIMSMLATRANNPELIWGLVRDCGVWWHMQANSWFSFSEPNQLH